MAMAMGIIGPSASPAASSPAGGSMGRSRTLRGRRKTCAGAGVRCSAAAVGGLSDQYRKLRLQPGASEGEVKKAFRQLALQYHPDVCKESNCGVKFQKINEAYDMIISSLRQPEEPEQWASGDDYPSDDDDCLRGMNDPNWEMWEEWMGWEGAGIRDYSSHINPYI